LMVSGLQFRVQGVRCRLKGVTLKAHASSAQKPVCRRQHTAPSMVKVRGGLVFEAHRLLYQSA